MNQTQHVPLQNRRRHHKTHNGNTKKEIIHNLLDENEKDWEKIVTIYNNNKENKEKLEQKSTKGKDIQQKVKLIQWESQLTDKHTEKKLNRKQNNRKSTNKTKMKHRKEQKENRGINKSVKKRDNRNIIGSSPKGV